MAGIIAIYGLVVSVLISNDLSQQNYPLFTGFIQLGAGLSVGLAGLAAGFAIGIVGDAGVRGTAQQPRLFVGMILILIFAEVLGKLDCCFVLARSVCSHQLYRSLRSHCCPPHELESTGFLLDDWRETWAWQQRQEQSTRTCIRGSWVDEEHGWTW